MILTAEQVADTSWFVIRDAGLRHDTGNYRSVQDLLDTITDLRSRLAAKDAEIGAAFQKAALEARQLVHHAYRTETNSSVVEQLVEAKVLACGPPNMCAALAEREGKG